MWLTEARVLIFPLICNANAASTASAKVIPLIVENGRGSQLNLVPTRRLVQSECI